MAQSSGYDTLEDCRPKNRGRKTGKNRGGKNRGQVALSMTGGTGDNCGTSHRSARAGGLLLFVVRPTDQTRQRGAFGLNRTAVSRQRDRRVAWPRACSIELRAGGE